MNLVDFKKELIAEVDNTIINCSKKLKDENGSFCELLKFPNLSKQSVSIKMGNVLEKIYNKFLNSFDGVENLKPVNKNISSHQIDLLFKKEDTIYYFESKLNLNLDTEKSKATINKVKTIESYLTKKYPNNKIVAKLLSSRFDKSENVKFIKEKYIKKSDVFGYSDFFKLFDIMIRIKEWEDLFSEIGERIVEATM